MRHDLSANSGNETSITSPLRRIPSFSESDSDGEEEKLDFKGNLLEENEFAQLNRTQEQQRNQQSKRGIEQEESSGSPLRKKTSSKASAISSTSLGARLRKFRSLTSEHCRTANFEAWSRELWQLGSWWMEIAAEEAAGVVYDLVEEFKREQAREKGLLVIPTVSGNAFLDKLQAKSLMILGKNEEALQICKATLKLQLQSNSIGDLDGLVEIRFLEGCLSRALGKIPDAIESFEQVLKIDPNHVEAHDHLYGVTCGLLPYKARDSEEDALVQAYRQGKYKRIIDATMETLWTRWFGDETATVLLVSSLACAFDSSGLYTIGQRLVNQRPDSSVSWYCVGLFYQVTGRSDEARRYLFKAGIGSKMKKSGAFDVGIGPAWIALGHSFAAYGDHDQAVSAYVAAVKTHSPGSVDPSLFLAIEYLRVRLPTLSAAYLLDAHAANPTDPRVLNELACLQAGKENYSAAKKFLERANRFAADSLLPDDFKIPLALNYAVVSVKLVMESGSLSAESVKSVLDWCVNVLLSPLQGSVRKSLTRGNGNTPNVLSLFPWTVNSAHPSAEFLFTFTLCALQEWRALLCDQPELSAKLSEEALTGYRCLLECRNEHRNLAMESVLIERQNRLLCAHSTLSPIRAVEQFNERTTTASTTTANTMNFKTPRTPLFRSHSLADSDSFVNTTSSSTNNSHLPFTPHLSFSGGTLPTTASSIVASASRRRLSLRRQMTGLRFDPSASPGSSSLESAADASFLLTATQINDDLMLTVNSNILTDDCVRTEPSEEDMQLDSED